MDELLAIVDDCKEVRFLVELLVKEELGIPCLALGSLAEVETQRDPVLRSSAIVVDINLGMGKPDGVDVYRWLQKEGYAGTVVFLTGHAKDSPQVQAAANTGVHIYEKPMTAQELVSLLKGFLSGQKKHAVV